MAKIRKALFAALAAGGAALGTAAADGNISMGDWGIILGAVVLAGVGVFWVPNAGPTPPAGVTGQYVGK